VDSNGNGVLDGDEAGRDGVTVRLLDESGNPVLKNSVAVTTQTAGGGYYKFEGLIPGKYTIQFDKPEGYTFTSANAGDDAEDSDANVTTGKTGVYELSSGEYDETADAGLVSDAPVPPPPTPASLGDKVWVDDGDGIQEEGEAGLANVTIELRDATGLNLLESTKTDSQGQYLFNNLAAGTYTVKFLPVSGYTLTTANAGLDTTDSDANPTTGLTGPYTLAPGDNVTIVDAGFVAVPPPPPPPASLGDRVWVDANGNGLLDGGEVGRNGVTVHLLDEQGHAVLKNGVAVTTQTAGGGYYKFEGLAPGKYIVQFDAPENYRFTAADAGNDASDSDAGVMTGKTGVYDLSSGEYDDTADAGLVYVPPVTPPVNPPPGPPGKYDDLIEAGDGNDVVYAGHGNDEVQGEGGNDHITGGTDEGRLVRSSTGKLSVAIGDNLYGNDGNDTYHYAKGDGVDMIWDFRPGEDVIDVTGFDPSQVKVTRIGALTNWIQPLSHSKFALIFGNDEGAIVFNDFPAQNPGDVILRFGNQTLTLANLLNIEQPTTGGAAITGHTPDLSVPDLPDAPSDNEVSGGNGNNIIVGSGGVDRFYGNAGYNWLEGLGGNDLLFGGNQSDVLLGGTGRDRLYGNEGANWLEGDAGQDELYGGNTQDVLLAGSDKDLVYGNGGNDLIVGGEGSDKLYGAGGRDTIYGDGAEDLLLMQPAKPHAGLNEVYTIKGSAAANTLNGSAADEILKALDGNDVVKAGQGDDWVEGDEGKDILSGGTGAFSHDTFVFDTALGKNNVDKITDFEWKYDQIFLDDAFFKGLVKGIPSGNVLRKDMFAVNNTGLSTSDDAQIVYEKDTGKLYYDKDGAGGAAAVHFATLAPKLALTFQDIEII
jgi:Ca2+-binding RTX toxin-like protein